MSLDVNPSPGPQDETPKSAESGFTEEEWKKAVIIGPSERSSLPVLPPQDHLLVRIFSGALEATVQHDLGLALEPGVQDRLISICIKSCHIDWIFPFNDPGVPPSLVLRRAIEQGPTPENGVALSPHTQRTFYANIGDAVLAGLSLLKGFLDIGLRHQRVPSHQAHLELGEKAYAKASALPDEPYSGDSHTFRSIARNMEECAVILTLTHQRVLVDQQSLDNNKPWLPRVA